MKYSPLDIDGPVSTPCFDDNSQVVESVDFQYPDDEPQPDTERETRASELVALVRYLVSNTRTCIEVGKRTAMLAHILRIEPCTQKELARKLGISEARTSTAIKKMRCKLLGIKARK